jgi:EmrB/QacA subfamily drug resistance transporter
MAAVAMGVFLSTIDSSIVNVALPTLVRAFDTEFPMVQWVVLAYLLTVTTLMLSVGRLADMIGKKTLYAAGFVIFVTGSALCGLSPTVQWLIGFRVLQAVGAAMVMALGMAIVTEAFPASERGRALGISGAVVSIGIVVGPTLGGFLIDALSWRWIFYVNLPIGLIGIPMVIRFVPNIRPTGGQRFDYAGAITLFASLMALLLALTWGQDAGFGNPRILALFVVWIVFLVLFVLIERRAAQPMIDLRLFRNSLFDVNLFTGFVAFICISGTLFLMPFYLEDILGYSPRSVGLMLAVVPIGLGLTAPLSGALSDRYGSRPITAIGLGVLVIGYLAVRTLSADTSTLGYLLRFMPIGIGIGIFQSPNNSAIMGTAPRERLGVVSGLLAITRTLGQTTGIATLGAIWASNVLRYAGAAVPGGATAAPAAAQMRGLHDTFLIVVILICPALALSVWALVQERRRERRPMLVADSPPG